MEQPIPTNPQDTEVLPTEKQQQPDINISAETEAAIPEKEVNPFAKLEAENNDIKDKYIRLVAEFDNYKKRSSKERIEIIQTAGREILNSLLDVLDDTERANKQFEKESDLEKLKEGVNLIFGKFKTTLLSKGLKKMDSLRTDFDAEKHEAITEIEAPENDKGKVVDVVQDGYLLNDKIIRFAKVVVGK